MSGIVAVYGLVVSVLIVGRRKWRRIASFIQTSPHYFCWLQPGPQSIRHKTTLSILVLCIWEQGLRVV